MRMVCLHRRLLVGTAVCALFLLWGGSSSAQTEDNPVYVSAGLSVGFQNGSAVPETTTGRGVSIAFQNSTSEPLAGRGLSVAFQNAPPTQTSTTQAGVSVA